MPGFHLTVGYLPYRFRPQAIGPGYYEMCSRRAYEMGKPMPEYIDGSMVLCSSPSQKVKDYQVIIRDSSWEIPWYDWGSEVAMAGTMSGMSRWLPTELPPPEDVYWEQYDLLHLIRFIAGLFLGPSKIHYYFKNYEGTVDCFVHYNHEMSRGWTFDHYKVLDIWDPAYYNVGKNYVYQGRVSNPHWLTMPRTACL